MENWTWALRKMHSGYNKMEILPTQRNVGSGPYPIQLNYSIPYYDRMISMIPSGHRRPSTAEYPQIGDHVSKALDQICSGLKEPKQTLNYATKKSAKTSGW